MNIYNYQEAFGASDKTTRAMRRAIKEWFGLYFQQPATEESNPCQRIAYTVVNKITKAVFSEYQAVAQGVAVNWLEELNKCRKDAMQLALIGGECYIKPCPTQAGFSYTLIPRDHLLIFARDASGMPVDVGTAECSTLGKHYYTLLERRRVEGGMLTVENQLFRSYSREQLGQKVALQSHPAYKHLKDKWRYPLDSVGLVRVKTPMVNCVDGSADGVAVFAPAAQLIRAIDENEAQMMGEFQRGQSRVFLSKDLLDRDRKLTSHLFVGLDEDPETVGITVFAPQLREQSFLARKQEYLRNAESILGLKRGMLSDANMDERTATEIAASQADYSLTVMDFQTMWQSAAEDTMTLCGRLAAVFGMEMPASCALRFDWGNGVLFDQEKVWQEYLTMADKGLIAPEIALGWRFGLPAETEEERRVIRQRFMPQV